MKLSILVLLIIVGAMFSSLATAAELDKEKTKIGITELNGNGHNSTRSNRGSIAAPTDTDDETWNQDVANLGGQMKRTKDSEPQNDTKIHDGNLPARKGRNPQTGKEINISKKKDLNPQTGKKKDLDP